MIPDIRDLLQILREGYTRLFPDVFRFYKILTSLTAVTRVYYLISEKRDIVDTCYTAFSGLSCFPPR